MKPINYMATLAAMMLLGGQSYAADLGGNCCADLEDRIAELEATTARKGTRKVSLEVSGHVNQAVIAWDGFGDSDKAVINNTNSESRFRVRGASKINSDWSAGFLMEFSVGNVANSGELGTRHAALYIKSTTLGTVWLGETSTATDGIVEISLASQNASILGSLAPFDAYVEDQTGIGIVNPFDGSRKNTVRYISPELGGFVMSAAWIGGDDDFDVALRYAGEFGAMRVAAGIGYRREQISSINLPTDDRRFWGGSASVMHTPTGLFLDGQYGNSDGMQTVNLTLPIIGKLLGHASVATTQRYAHLADDPLRRGADVIAARIKLALEG